VSAAIVDFCLERIVLTVYSHLSLICLMGKGSGVDKRVLIDYNVSLLQDAVVEVFRV
jgi:Ras-related GTP-binding protein C/D